MDYNTVIYEKKESIGSITLNLSDSGDVITNRLSEELADICASVTSDEEIMVVIITGGGKHFYVGSDLAYGEQETWLPSITQMIISINPPVIAAINGDALGHGLELALACDLRVAAETARFGLPQIISGFIPWDGGTQLLPRIVGKGKAMEMILTGEVIDATQAYNIGLVNKVVPLEELMPTVKDMAMAVTSKAPISLRYAKEAIHKGLDLTLEQGLRLEADLYHLLQTTEDRTEGIKAFQERRTPQFKGK